MRSSLRRGVSAFASPCESLSCIRRDFGAAFALASDTLLKFLQGSN
jgi:hypothetical protein